jgi:PAS domain S-box-containing protein
MPAALRTLVKPIRYVRLLALLTITAIVVCVFFLLWGLRDRELAHAGMETVSLTRMVMEQTEQQFQSVDMVLQGVQERLQTPFGMQLGLGSDPVHLLLSARVSGMRHVRSLFLVDAQGALVSTSRSGTVPPTALGDRDYFQVFAGGRADTLFIGKPVRSRLDAAWTLNLSRPLFDKNGSLRGVVVAAISIPEFEQIYSIVQLDYVRPIGFYLADGTLVASLPHRESMIGEHAVELTHESLPTKPREVRTIRHVSGSGDREVFAIGVLAGFPLMVSVTDDESLSLAAWRETAIPIGLGALLLSVFTALVAANLISKLQHRQQLTLKLNAADQRYQHTVNSVMDAIVAVDASLHITMFNPAAEAMFGHTCAELLGQPMEVLMPVRLRAAHQGHMRKFASSELAPRAMAPQMEIWGLRRNGEEFALESTISHSTIGGQLQMTAVLRDVTQRRKAEAELRMVNGQLRELSVSLQGVREEERKRISRELHDDLGQQLTGLKLSLSWLGSRLKEGRATAVQDVDEMRRQLDTAIGSVRRIAAELRPRVLDDLDFREALTWQMQEFFKHSGIQIELDLRDADQIRDDTLATALFRIVQEALTNVVRHAAADKVLVSLHAAGAQLLLRISDNGAGFDSRVACGGVGLVSMRERCSAVGASFQVHSSPGNGTHIEVAIPIQQDTSQ